MRPWSWLPTAHPDRASLAGTLKTGHVRQTVINTPGALIPGVADIFQWTPGWGEWFIVIPGRSVGVRGSQKVGTCLGRLNTARPCCPACHCVAVAGAVGLVWLPDSRGLPSCVKCTATPAHRHHLGLHPEMFPSQTPSRRPSKVQL